MRFIGGEEGMQKLVLKAVGREGKRACGHLLFIGGIAHDIGRIHDNGGNVLHLGADDE